MAADQLYVDDSFNKTLLSLLRKADSHKLHSTRAAGAEGCKQKNRKFSIPAAAAQPSATAACVKRSSLESAFFRPMCVTEEIFYSTFLTQNETFLLRLMKFLTNKVPNYKMGDKWNH